MSRSWSELIDLGGRAGPVGESPPPETAADGSSGKGAFARLRESLTRSRRALAGEIGSGLFDRLDDDTWERLEEALILADAGAPVTARLVGELEREVGTGEVDATPEAARARLVELIASTADTGFAPIDLSARPAVILVTGVNGTGKTTSIGKLAWHLRELFGLDVLLGAADTFRAAATEQLEAWAERSGAGIVTSQEGADPGAVAWDALEAGKARGVDVVIIDTAGRLQTQASLMEELGKVRRVIERAVPGAPHETLITIDAITGANGLSQARLFAEALPLDGVILTKLDGSAKGGVVLAIASDLGIPVKLVGLGEGIGDLRPFDPLEYARALVEA